MRLRKSDLATPICAAECRRSLFTFRRGVFCGAVRRREQDDHAHYDQKDLRVLFHPLDRFRLTNLDRSRFEKECNQCIFVL